MHTRILMTSPSRPRRLRRALAALAAVTALVATLQVIGATPAHADWGECFDWGCNIYGDGGSGGPNAGPGGGGGPLLGDGVEQPQMPGEDGGGGGGGILGPDGPSSHTMLVLGADVASLVDQKAGTYDCDILIAGPFLAGSPLGAQSVYRQAQIERSSTAHPQGAVATAPFNAGSLGTITIYPPYDQYNGGDILGFIPPNTKLSRTPSRTEFKAMHVLHEVAHLTGANPHHVPNNSDAREFNLKILNKCFGITSTPN